MARQKRVFRDASEVAHIWAQQSQDEGRTPTGHCYFTGDTIYSYGSHFPMAKFHEHDGKHCILFTYRTYSNTTAKHLGCVRDAVRGLGIPVFIVHHVRDTVRVSEVIQQYTARMMDLILRAGKARTNANWYLECAMKQTQMFNEMAEFFGWTDHLELPADSVEKAKQAVANAARVAKANKDKRLAALAQSEIDNAHLITLWRQCGKPAPEQKWKGPQLERTLLRINGDNVETSRGALVSIKSAKRLWPFILKRTAPSNTAVDHYNVREIKANGDIVIGCHHIEFREVEYIARELKLI